MCQVEKNHFSWFTGCLSANTASYASMPGHSVGAHLAHQPPGPPGAVSRVVTRLYCCRAQAQVLGFTPGFSASLAEVCGVWRPIPPAFPSQKYRKGTLHTLLSTGQTPEELQLVIHFQVKYEPLLSETNDPASFFYSSSSLWSVTSQFNEEDAAEDHSKSPAKANVDDISGSGSRDLVISSPKVTVCKYSHVGYSQLPFPSRS